MLASPRFASLAAIAGAVLGLALTPPMATVWAYDPPINWAGGSWVMQTFGPSLEEAGALSFEVASLTPYEVYGKGFFLVYLLMAPMVWQVHRVQRESPRAGRLERWTWNVMWVTLLAAALGDFTSYWGVSLPGFVGGALWGGGFGIELLAFFVLIVSTTVYGVVSVWLRVLPIWVSLLLVAVIPISMLGFYATQYIPNAVAVPLSILWAVIGVWFLFQPQEARVAA